MLPNSTENILQDTNNVPDTLVTSQRRSRLLVVILLLCLGIGLRMWVVGQMKKSAPAINQLAVASVPTPLPPTGTFVDQVFGTVIFSKDSSVHVLSLPSRIEHTIQGTSSVQIDTTYPVVWSPDGKLIALVTKEKAVSVSEFDTGKYRGTYALPKDSSAATTSFSIDPASEILTISMLPTSKSDSVVHFYSLATQQEIGVYSRCSGTGVWVTGIGYAMVCTVADSQSVVIIRFEPNSSAMTPLTRETASVKYQLIDEYRQGILLMKRTLNGKDDLVTLSVDGKVTAIPPSEYKPITDIGSLVDTMSALRIRIEKEAHTAHVLDVTVSDDNSFLIFETADGLYAAKLDLKDAPFFLGKGSMPRIRPN